VPRTIELYKTTTGGITMSINIALTEENKRIVEGIYAAGARGDFQSVMACMDENIVVIEPPYLPYGGTYRGIAEFQKLMGLINEYADMSTVSLQYAVAEGDKVFVALQFKDRKTGKMLQLVEQSIVRDGKIVEMKIFYFDAGSMIEAGLKTKA
jgi:ketosteroid isomerase-like protein